MTTDDAEGGLKGKEREEKNRNVKEENERVQGV